MGSGLLIHLICRGVNIDVGILCLAADLLVLDMEGYDVILGGDWLAVYQAMVDYFGRTIVFSIPGQDMFLVAVPLPERGSSIQYYIEEETSQEVVVFLNSIPAVREFEDIFQEIPGLSPSWKIKFFIDLAQGTSPIDRVPYHMVPSEMRELREKIQQLLGQGL